MITLIEDTRQQQSKHIYKNNFFQRHGIKVIRSKLPVGDYALLTDMSRCIDTKNSLEEIVMDLTKAHGRFRREADLAYENGIELIILIEQFGMKTLEDVKRWDNPRMHRWNKINYMHEHGKWLSVPLPKQHPVDNITLYKIMYTFGKKHHVRWEFCNPKDAGQRVIELLIDGKEIHDVWQPDAGDGETPVRNEH